MTTVRISAAIVFPCLWVFVTMAMDVTKVPNAPLMDVNHQNNMTNSSIINTTKAGKGTGKKIMPLLNVNSSMIQRALYVLIGITMIGVLYFLVRAVRLKKPTQKKKYGLLSDYDETMEMDAMESDDDETVYEARRLRS